MKRSSEKKKIVKAPISVLFSRHPGLNRLTFWCLRGGDLTLDDPDKLLSRRMRGVPDRLGWYPKFRLKYRPAKADVDDSDWIGGTLCEIEFVSWTTRRVMKRLSQGMFVDLSEEEDDPAVDW